MSDMNFAGFTGRLGRKPELRKTPSGISVADFSIANNIYGSNKKEKTTWIRCVVWNKPAEWAAENLDKGDCVAVQGQIVDDNYKPEGSDTATKGRVKLDNVKVQLLYKARKKDDASSTQDDGNVDADQAQD